MCNPGNLLKLEGFLCLYTLQVGVTTFCSWGLGLMSISVSVNISHLFSSLAYAELADEITFEESCTHYVIFAVFIILGYLAYLFGLAGAYQENTFPLKLALGFLAAQASIWFLFTYLSFLNVEQLTGYLCLFHLRCADRFFISNANWRYSREDPDYFYNFVPSANPSLSFRTRKACEDYCWIILISPTEMQIMTEDTTNGIPFPDYSQCMCEKQNVNTLIGPLGSISHLIVSIIYALAIICFWYGYCICIFVSYIRFLNEKIKSENRALRRTASRA